MKKQIYLYLILLLTLVGISFFITSNFIQEDLDKKSSNLEIFQAKEVNLNLNFFESDLDLNLKSSMINGLANSNTLKAFERGLYLP